MAPAFQPIATPITTSARSEPTFATVNTFCIDLPYLMPLVLVQVNNEINATPTSCAVESETA